MNSKLSIIISCIIITFSGCYSEGEDVKVGKEKAFDQMVNNQEIITGFNLLVDSIPFDFYAEFRFKAQKYSFAKTKDLKPTLPFTISDSLQGVFQTFYKRLSFKEIWSLKEKGVNIYRRYLDRDNVIELIVLGKKGFDNKFLYENYIANMPIVNSKQEFLLSKSSAYYLKDNMLIIFWKYKRD